MKNIVFQQYNDLNKYLSFVGKINLKHLRLNNTQFLFLNKKDDDMKSLCWWLPIETLTYNLLKLNNDDFDYQTCIETKMHDKLLS